MTIDFLNGYLKAMEEVNHRTNHGYTFEMRKMEDKHDLHASIIDAFTFQGVTDVLGYKPCSKETLIKAINYWFFEKENETKGEKSIDEDDQTQAFVQHLFQFLSDDVQIYELESECGVFFMYCTNFVFVGSDSMYALELGVND
ncbi:hypothetical protein OZL92_09070 [Bacillus sonorensis]|uniref:Uncharacterized protein n=2 Tax=Bacillus sonorensis TaxID=119858 RepID=M5P1G0_9BACI|nr:MULTISPECIES: hypothetical protein [Bacillus]TWK79547.1 hypothetical protein CHCC20335_0324 [Bacillus paralicheniformis]ASB87251.1 hypothetical protein S101395_00697 [Bacillus sonorensis]EME73268.1 hypothetical protein BSONL12_16129 [Bacillus sonorensis L12]MBG9914258.1 hypothetical protein [Bacillus sonorensis]MCF7616498.1 hypothetical protein [Bacillus sonorensis]